MLTFSPYSNIEKTTKPAFRAVPSTLSVTELVDLITRKVQMLTKNPRQADSMKSPEWSTTVAHASFWRARGSSVTAAAEKSQRAEMGAIQYCPSIT